MWHCGYYSITKAPLINIVRTIYQTLYVLRVTKLDGHTVSKYNISCLQKMLSFTQPFTTRHCITILSLILTLWNTLQFCFLSIIIIHINEQKPALNVCYSWVSHALDMSGYWKIWTVPNKMNLERKKIQHHIIAHLEAYSKDTRNKSNRLNIKQHTCCGCDKFTLL